MVMEEFAQFIKTELSKEINEIIQEKLNERIDHFKAALKKTLIVGGLTGIGLLFLFMGLVIYLPSILKLSEAVAYFIVGAILIIVALIFRAGAKT
jgi:hypothetical protein